MCCRVTGTIVKSSGAASGDTSSLLPTKTVNLLKDRLKYFDLIFNSGELDHEERARGKFIILCETFLQMYKAIFEDLVPYLNNEEFWQILPSGNVRERRFDVSLHTHIIMVCKSIYYLLYKESRLHLVLGPFNLNL